MKQIAQALLLLLIISVLTFSSCRKDEFNTSADFKLEFSTDTIMFDTVFTTIGSSTRSLVIRNTGNTRLNISKITLARGSASPFRLNIDGTPAEEYHNLEIGANDSAYIFVKVTIDPNNVNSPLVESDSVVFETNGSIQNVKLVAWGQDAYFHHNIVLTGDVTLPNDKPHVIYGKFTAGNGCNLQLVAGTRLYFHNNSSLEIRKGASLVVAGTLELPVTFSGDRLEDFYENTPGMWDGIWLENGSNNTNFTYAEITNAKVGIQADSFGLTNGDTLQLHNCMIHNMTNYGIRATNSRIIATNCQVTNCGVNVVSIEQGGDYDFRNCTLARYFSGRPYPALYISNYITDTAGKELGADLTRAFFGNCIITGNQSSEIIFDEKEGNSFVFNFDYCLVNWDQEYYKKYKSRFTNCISNEDALFMDSFKNDFQLDTLSYAIDTASLFIINQSYRDITHDRKGVSRILTDGGDGKPDMGAYERVELK